MVASDTNVKTLIGKAPGKNMEPHRESKWRMEQGQYWIAIEDSEKSAQAFLSLSWDTRSSDNSDSPTDACKLSGMVWYFYNSEA
jgi:hypothetical protein